MTEVVVQTLETIVKASGLEESKAALLRNQFQEAYDVAAEWEKKAKTIVVTSVTQTNEMRAAREARLQLKERRVEVEKRRKEMKEQSLREGKAIDNVANFLKGLIEPIEEYLGEQEKFAEVQEEKRQAALKAERIEKVKDLPEIDPSLYDFGNMPEEAFVSLIEGTKLAKAKREEDERKAAEERAAKEKADAEERERMRAENERLRKEGEEIARKAEEDRKKAEAERKAIEDKAAADRKAAEEKAAKEKAEAEAKAKKEREAQEAQLKAEREERERLEAELKAKKDAEEKAAKKRAEAERKAKAAPDRHKALAYIGSFSNMPCPPIKEDDVVAIVGDFNDAIAAAVEKATKQIKALE